MNKLKALMAVCLRQRAYPEMVLMNVVPTGFEDPAHSGSAGELAAATADRTLDELFQEAVTVRFPDLLGRLIVMRGVSAAGIVPRLEMLVHARVDDRDADATEIVKEEMGIFVELYRVGISLSWWLFGLGEPVYRAFFMADLDPAKGLDDYMRNLNYKQGWSDLEAKWFITQTHGKTASKLTHKVMIRVMSGMPKMELFPPVPQVTTIYKRLQKAVAEFVIPDDSPEWLRDTIGAFQESSWKICTLLLVRQGSVSHWQVVNQSPRRKSTRLAFAINLLFDIYGEQKGLEYYLSVLNLEAQAQGFRDFSIVARGAVWNPSVNSVHTQEE